MSTVDQLICCCCILLRCCNPVAFSLPPGVTAMMPIVNILVLAAIAVLLTCPTFYNTCCCLLRWRGSSCCRCVVGKCTVVLSYCPCTLYLHLFYVLI
mmetsp:Transcript_14175/g.12123  ORF Transcript_14175/g.12123 Transcript_14175/m.12123 type:complete len:97 (+) Transcript_14175:249-539(+)